MKKYDYLIVGSGLFGSVFAHQAGLKNKRCLVVEKRAHAGGNLYCETIEDIHVHAYGAHIFHTSDREVWKYVNELVEFNHYINSPVANYNGELYNLPFNMNTFYRMWGVKTPEEAQRKIAQEVAEYAHIEPQNLEEQALKLVGKDIYFKLIKGYTEKQWGRKATELPAFIIKRIPLRFIFDNNYFNDPYQGIPIGGYNLLINKLLTKADVELNVQFLAEKEKYEALADTIIYTGMIDEYFGYDWGRLEYRSLRFETQTLDIPDYQGNAVVNYTDSETPYTRVIEHKHFEFGRQPKTVITHEFPQTWDPGKEAYYPINDEKNNALFTRYRERAAALPHIVFGGRLADYAYYDMDKTIRKALDIFHLIDKQ
ncbi:MAG: UDP-galactopyranose mutase [Dysgonamonadaceae bacterium]|jgi:UDP-galactopyranose mutase|nr:UDP-galactopyranose mutase [Dysgonamonadaceae bacterium]